MSNGTCQWCAECAGSAGGLRLDGIDGEGVFRVIEGDAEVVEARGMEDFGNHPLLAVEEGGAAGGQRGADVLQHR